MGFGIKQLVDQRDPFQSVEEPFRAVIIPLLPGILMIHTAMSTFVTTLLCGLNQLPLPVQHADAVVGKQHKFPECVCPRRHNHRLLLIILLHGAEGAVVFCPRWLDDDCPKQAVVPVVSHIPEGPEQADAILPVSMPKILDGFPRAYGLLYRIIPHIQAGGPDWIVLQELRIQ